MYKQVVQERGIVVSMEIMDQITNSPNHKDEERRNGSRFAYPLDDGLRGRRGAEERIGAGIGCELVTELGIGADLGIPIDPILRGSGTGGVGDAFSMGVRVRRRRGGGG